MRWACVIVTGAAAFLVSRLYTRGESIWPDFIGAACFLTALTVMSVLSTERPRLPKFAGALAIVTSLHAVVLLGLFRAMVFIKPLDLRPPFRRGWLSPIILVALAEYWLVRCLLAAFAAREEGDWTED